MSTISASKASSRREFLQGTASLAALSIAFAWVGPARRDHVAHVRGELVARPHNERQVLGQVVVENAEDVAGPTREELPVLGRGAEEFADDRDGVRLADVRHQFALAVGHQAVDQFAHHSTHGGTEAIGRGGCEGRGHQSPETGVARAFHGQDRLTAAVAGGGGVDRAGVSG